MLQTLRNAWSIPELRKKIIFTLTILMLYRVGNVIPVPFIDVATLANYFDSVSAATSPFSSLIYKSEMLKSALFSISDLYIKEEKGEVAAETLEKVRQIAHILHLPEPQTDNLAKQELFFTMV